MQATEELAFRNTSTTSIVDLDRTEAEKGNPILSPTVLATIANVFANSIADAFTDAFADNIIDTFANNIADVAIGRQ